MKKLSTIALSFFLIFFSLFAISFAQEKEDSDLVEVSPTPFETVDYTLAYPGVLPDNPLYFLKAVRDRIIGFLINDPVKKAEFNLLTSDKRLYASLMLLEKDKQGLAITTLSKSNNYLHNAIASLSEGKSMGENVDIVLSNLQNAIKKREEVFSSMREKINSENKSGLESETTRLTNLKNNADSLVSN